MEGVRFYAEMQDERGSKAGSKRWAPFTRATLAAGAAEGQRCNVVAVLHANGSSGGMVDSIAAVNGVSNAQVMSAASSLEYLRKRCVRVPESLARKLHPRLFATLDKKD